MDRNDNIEIRKLVDNVLTTLVRAGYLSLCGKTYCTKSTITNESNLTIFDELPNMSTLTPKQIQRLNSIDVSMTDDPSTNLAIEENENII